MTREERLMVAFRLRKGQTTAVIGRDKHKRRYTESSQTHESLNQAKRKNGCDAVALGKHEHFPPTLAELPKIEEPQAEPAAE